MHDPTIEPLEHNSELGVYIRQTSQDSDCVRDVYFAQFNPKHRLLATAGNGYMAHLWDLTKEDFSEFKKAKIPHCRREDQEN